METLIDRINRLSLGKSLGIYEYKGAEIFIHRPESIPTHLKQKANYDPHKNFQIFLRLPGIKAFKPNHLRILLDLHLKNVSNPNNANFIFDSFEHIYNKEDPKKFIPTLENINFRMQIDSAVLNLLYGQLFMVEQEINYTFGQVNPPRAFLMGYIRLIKSGEYEIDRVLWSATRNPPPVRFWRDYTKPYF